MWPGTVGDSDPPRQSRAFFGLIRGRRAVDSTRYTCGATRWRRSRANTRCVSRQPRARSASPACEDNLGIGFVPFSTARPGISHRHDRCQHVLRQGRLPQHCASASSAEARLANQALVEIGGLDCRRQAVLHYCAPVSHLVVASRAKPFIVPIPVHYETRAPHRDNYDAVAVELTVVDLREIDEALALIKVHWRSLPAEVGGYIAGR